MLDLPPPPVPARASDTAASGAYAAYLEGRGYLARYDLRANIDKAIASFVRATEQDTTYAMAYAGLAEAYWRKARSTNDGKWMELASQNAVHGVRVDPNLAMAHTILGTIYSDSGNQTEAIREFELALRQSSKNAEAARQLAELYSTLGRFQEAEDLYLRSTKARPTDWYGHFILGLFYARRQRYSEAIAALQQAKALASDNDLVRYNLGRIYRAQGRYDEAISELQEALRIRSNALFYAALGGVYYFQHRFTEAVTALDTAIDLDPNTYWYWGNLGVYAKRDSGNAAKSQAALRRAIELAEKALQGDKANYSVRANLAEYRARMGDEKGALSDLEQIPEVARAPLTSRFAIVYELIGRRDEAVAVVRKHLKNPLELALIKDDPDLSAVWRALR
jgi:serine/threonine-protein kinase